MQRAEAVPVPAQAKDCSCRRIARLNIVSRCPTWVCAVIRRRFPLVHPFRPYLALWSRGCRTNSLALPTLSRVRSEHHFRPDLHRSSCVCLFFSSLAGASPCSESETELYERGDLHRHHYTYRPSKNILHFHSDALCSRALQRWSWPPVTAVKLCFRYFVLSNKRGRLDALRRH